MIFPARSVSAIVLLVFAIVILLYPPLPACANIIINPTFDTTITSDSNATAIEGVINSAISVYEAYIATPITVNITFQETNVGLGSSSSFVTNISYSSFRTALAASATDNVDNMALAFLPTGTTNPVTGSTTINVKTANARAIGISANPPSDGTVSLNTSITNPGSPGTTGQFFLKAVVEHEINEVLGMGSQLGGGAGDPYPSDLFRYDSSGNRSFTTNSSAIAFFSVNRFFDYAQFDNQNDGGDFGDWQSNPLPGGVLSQVQDAFLLAGSTPALGSNELTLLDALGYAIIPEPGSIALVFGGLGLLLVLRRKPANHE